MHLTLFYFTNLNFKYYEENFYSFNDFNFTACFFY